MKGMKTNWTKRLLSIICVITMTFGLCSTQLFAEAETTIDKYTTLTFSDFFGPTKGKVTCDSTTSHNIESGIYGKSLHNLKIVGYYNFAEGGSSTSFVCFGENVDNSLFLTPWSSNNTGERILLGVNARADVLGGFTQVMTLSLNDYNNTSGATKLDSWFGQDQLKISVAFSYADPESTSTTLSIEVIVNDVYTVKHDFTEMNATVSATNGQKLIAKSTSASITLTSVEDEKEYLSFTDFFGTEKTKVTYDSTTSVVSDYGKYSDSLHHLRVEGYYNFAEKGTSTSIVCFGGNNTSGSIFLGAWTNDGATGTERIMLGRAGADMDPFNTGVYKDQFKALMLSDYNAAADEAGVERLSSFYGQDLFITTEFSFQDPTSTSTDLRVLLIVNNVYRVQLTISGMDATAFEGSMCVKSKTKPITLTSIVEESPYTELTFTDFDGFDDYMVIKGVDGSNVDELKAQKDDSLQGYLFSGYMNFGAGNATNRMWFGAGANDWKGFAIENAGTTNINFTLYNQNGTFEDGTKSYTLTPSLYNAATTDISQQLTSLIGEDLKMSVGFLYANGAEDNTATTTLTITITINDVYVKELKVINTTSGDMKGSIAAQSKGPELVIKTSPYKYATFTDFGFENEVSLSKNSQKYQLNTSLHNYQVEGYVTFGDDDSVSDAGSSGIAYGVANDWTKGFFVSPWDGSLLFYYGAFNQGYGQHYGDGCYFKLTPAIYNTATGENISSFSNQKLKLNLTFVYGDVTSDSTKLTVLVKINDVYEHTMEISAVDATAMKYMGIASSGSVGTPITVTSTSPVVDKISLQDDLLIAPGKYDDSYTVDGQYLTYNNGDTAIVNSLLNTTLTQKITFSQHAKTYLYFAGTSATSGIRFATQSNGTIQMLATNGEFTGEYLLTEAFAGTKLLGQEIELTLKLYEDGDNAKLEVYINGKLYKNRPFILTGAADKFGSYIRFAVTDADGYVQIGNKADAEYYNLAYGTDEEGINAYTITGLGRIMINGKQLDKDINYEDWLITEPGDYWISADVTRKWDAEYAKGVILYYYGDAHVDGQMDVRDIIATKKSQAGIELNTWAAEKGADANGDGAVNASDAKAVREYVLDSSEVQKINDNAVYFDSPDVMPIVGNNGPYRTTDLYGNNYDFLTEDVYQAIKDVGINTIFTTGAYYTTALETDTDEQKEKIADQQEQIFTGLEMAQKHNLNVLIRDARLGWKDSHAISRSLMETFAKYSSFKGYHVIDEPYTKYYYHEGTDWDNTPTLADYASSSKMTNMYANTLGYVNLLRINSELNKSELSLSAVYDKYLEEYITNHNPKLLSFDYYPFIDSDTTRVAGYLENLSVIRAKATANKIPFWSYIQVGDNYNDNMNKGIASTTNGNPSKGELLWNVNTSLAYGAKGIAYFTLIQPPHFSQTTGDTNDYTRNGLIGAGAGLAGANVESYKTEWYGYAKNANSQVAEVDAVLMYAKSKEVLATGTAATKTKNTLATKDSQGVLDSITASTGALVGVFEYQGKTAFYVVNDDVVNAQTITLNFKEAKKYFVSSKQCTSATESAEAASCSMTLEAGGAALVIVE